MPAKSIPSPPSSSSSLMPPPQDWWNAPLSGRLTRWHAALLALLLLGGVLRLHRLDVNPLWYTDECIYAVVARTAAESGEFRYGALQFPFGRQSLAKPPFWFILAAPLQWLPGEAMMKGRLVSALVSLALMWVIAVLGRRQHSAEAGLLAAWLSLVHTPALLYFRWATPYPLAGLLGALAVLMIASGESNRRLVLAGALVGLAMITEFFSVQMAAFVIVWAMLRRRWRDLPAVILAMAAPPLAFVLWGALARGSVFFQELFSLFIQIGEESRSTSADALRQILFALRVTLTHDLVFAAGIASLTVWATRGLWRRPRALSPGAPVGLYLLCMMPLILRRQGFDPEVPHNLPEYSFAIYLGFGVGVAAAAKWLALLPRQESQRMWARRLIAGVVAAAGLGWSGWAFHAVATEIPMGAKAIGSVRSVIDARNVARQLHALADPADILIVPDRLLPAAPGRAATAMQSVLAEAFATGADQAPVHWHAHVRPGELAFRPTLDQARLIVVDEWDRINGLNPRDPRDPHPLAILMRERGWRPLAVLGEYEIYAPPRPR